MVDRLKELMKVNGYQVAPPELEALLVQHDGVADAAVVGRPDPRTGEVPVTVIVPCGVLDPDELNLWVAQRVAPYKRLVGCISSTRCRGHIGDCCAAGSTSDSGRRRLGRPLILHMSRMAPYDSRSCAAEPRRCSSASMMSGLTNSVIAHR